ncbi:unnamed protein product [Angiostrongylus costaricensis]|uniref:Disintegrin domain-containing protein n=1 Tax=Angiostrongylus costaricensis TaxID=334426 RepID=A0A0R3PHJ3_ANGCS|nr:unnamed protein product [Angiostrongylus costaricensis]
MPCKTNEDCGDEEFCDEAVNYDKSSSANVEKMTSFLPKMCFPAPRCAGKAAKEPGGIGIKTCKQSSDCGATEFCDIQSNADNPVAAFNNLGVCCQYDCTEEGSSAIDAANATRKLYARLAADSVQCNNDNDCNTGDERGKCITAKDKGTPIAPLEKGKPLKLCCLYPRRMQEDLYRCLGGDPAYDTAGEVIKCEADKDCNKVAGQPLSDQSTWDFECVTAGGPGDGFCCPGERHC